MIHTENETKQSKSHLVTHKYFVSVLEEAYKVALTWTISLLWGLRPLVHTCPLLQLVVAHTLAYSAYRAR